MTEFSDKLKGLLNPNKDKDIKLKLDKINEELEKSISLTITRGYDSTQFTIPQSFRYMCKEALLNIAENLEKEGYTCNKSDSKICIKCINDIQRLYIIFLLFSIYF